MRKLLLLCLLAMSCTPERPTSIFLDYHSVTPLAPDSARVFWKVPSEGAKRGSIHIAIDSIYFTSNKSSLNFTYAIRGFNGSYLASQFTCADDSGHKTLVMVSEEKCGYEVNVMKEWGGYSFAIDTVR